MVNCAVFGCNSNNNKRLLRNKNEFEREPLRFHHFPTDEKISKIWIEKCMRADRLNIKRAAICSKHFEQQHYDLSEMDKFLNCSPKRKLLKKGAIPTKNLPTSTPPKQDSTKSKPKAGFKSRKVLAKIIKKEIIPECNNDNFSTEDGDIQPPLSDIKIELDSSNWEEEADENVVLVKPETVLYNDSEEENDQSESEASCTDEIITNTNISEKAPSTMCRLCLSEEDIMCFLFAEDEKSKNVLKKIETVLQFKIRYSSNWPSMICIHCYAKINTTNKFIASSKANQISLFARFGASDEVNKVLKVENRSQQIPIEFIDVSTKIKKEPLIIETSKLNTRQLIATKPELFMKVIEPNERVILMPEEESQDNKKQTVNVLQARRSEHLNKTRVMSFEESVVWKTELLVCKYCSLVPFNFFEDYKNHVMFVHDKNESFTCCGLEFNSNKDLYNHIYDANHLLKSPLHCNFCDETFDLVNVFMAHKEEHLRCDICGVVSTDERSSRMHKRVHMMAKEKYSCCKFCDFIAENPKRLDWHKRKAHPNIYVFGCEICGYRFCYEDELKKHQYNVHERGDRQCKVCKKYVRNMSNHPCFKNNPMDCFLCGKQYKNYGSLQMHMYRIHKKKDPAKLTCPHCSKVCLRPETLKEHIATHTGEYLYKCRLCDKQFKTMMTKSTHMRKEHAEEVDKAKREKEEKRKLNEEYDKAATTYSVG